MLRPGLAQNGVGRQSAGSARPLGHENSPSGIPEGLFIVAGAGVEPATYRFSGDRSYQLSYPATRFHVKPQRS